MAFCLVHGKKSVQGVSVCVGVKGRGRGDITHSIFISDRVVFNLKEKGLRNETRQAGHPWGDGQEKEGVSLGMCQCGILVWHWCMTPGV